MKGKEGLNLVNAASPEAYKAYWSKFKRPAPSPTPEAEEVQATDTEASEAAAAVEVPESVLSLSPVYPDNQLGDSSIIQHGFEFEDTLRDSQAAGSSEMVPAAAVQSSTAMAKAPALATTPQQHVAVQPEPVATRPLEPECVPAQPPQPDSQQPLAAPPAQPEHQQQPLTAQPPQDTQQQPDLRRLVATDQLPTPSPSEASEMEADAEVLLNKKEMKEDQKSTPFRPNPDDVKAALLRKTTVDLMPPPAVPKRTQAAAAAKAAAPPPPPAVAEVASAMQVAPKDLVSHTSVVMNLGGVLQPVWVPLTKEQALAAGLTLSPLSDTATAAQAEQDKGVDSQPPTPTPPVPAAEEQLVPATGDAATDAPKSDESREMKNAYMRFHRSIHSSLSARYILNKYNNSILYIILYIYIPYLYILYIYINNPYIYIYIYIRVHQAYNYSLYI